MESVRPQVSRNPWGDPRSDQEEQGGVQTWQTQHSPTQAGGRGGTQVGEVMETGYKHHSKQFCHQEKQYLH